MRYRLSLVTLAFGVALLVAGCSQQPTPAPKVSSFTTSPSALASSGGSTSLSWSGSNVTGYTLSVSPSAGVMVNGAAYAKAVDLKASTSASVTLPSDGTTSSVKYTLTLTAAGASGTTAASKTVTVTVAAAGPSIASFTASPANLSASGGASTLSWSGSDVTDYSLTVSPTTGVKVDGTAYAGAVDLKTGTSAAVALPGNAGTAGTTYTFTLTAAGGSGTTAATKDVTVAVGAASPAIGSFAASPTTLPSAGGASSLTWTGSAVVDYQLTVSPTTGVTVNGNAYVGAVDLGTSTNASLAFPSNGTTGSIAYTFTLAATGGTGTRPASTTVTVAVTASPGNLWVANRNGSVVEYAASSLSGTPAIGARITGLNQPDNVAFDSSGNLWVADLVAGTVTEYRAPLSSTPSTGTVISGLNAPYGLAFDSRGNLWVGESSNGSVTEYLAPLSGTSSTGASITGHVGAPLQFAFDSSGNLWVPDYVGSVTEYPAPLPTSGSPTPGITIADSNGPMDVAFDGSGNLWVTDNHNGSVTEYLVPLSSSPSIGTTITGLSAPYKLAFDSSGNLWVAEDGNGSVVEYQAPLSNKPSVGATITGTDTWGIAFDPPPPSLPLH